jgi:mono/diheme cytochrome c family protein
MAKLILTLFTAFTSISLLVGQPTPGPDAVDAQGDRSKSPAGPPPVPSATAGARVSAAGALFRQHCEKCHEADGTGSRAREKMPQIPNFTNSTWHKNRSDAQLLASILDGKEPEMPSWRKKISEEQARGLVAHLRSFARVKGTSRDTAHKRFKEQFHDLQAQFEDLQKQGAQLSQGARGNEISHPTETPQQNGPRSPAPAPPPMGGSDAHALFAKHCVKCHGADGTGKLKRKELEQIPNFTDSSWQKKRTDAQLLAIILNGEEPDMPSWRKKISEEQARGLVAHIRAFASPRGSTAGASQNRPR